jgi:hypothetical protein
LAVTRFFGRPAPPFTGRVPSGRNEVMREAYSDEVRSAAFWPACDGANYAAFLFLYVFGACVSGAARFRRGGGVTGGCSLPPGAGPSHRGLGQFLLPYEPVRTARYPDARLLAFFQSECEAAAITGTWDRARLESSSGLYSVPCAVR